MTDRPFATCCVLSYQRPTMLAQSLSTLVTHADYPLELIVHDDGSTDLGLLEYLAKLQRNGMISTLILNTPGHNEGQGIALNRMFNMAKGRVILKLDQDLVYEEGWLQRMVETLDANPRIGLLGTFKYEHDPVDWRKCLVKDHGTWEEHSIICGSGFAMPRAAWEELGPFEEHSDAFAEDNVMQNKVTASEKWCCALPKKDLVTNVGFGVGPSTVVVDHGQVAKIHHGPRLFLPEKVGA